MQKYAAHTISLYIVRINGDSTTPSSFFISMHVLFSDSHS